MNGYEQLAQFGNTLTGFSNFANQGFSYPLKHEIITVSNLKEVQDFKLNKGDSYDLLDPNNDILYIKERDNIGRESIKVYKLTDITSQVEAETTPANITRQEYDSLVSKINALLENTERGVKNAVKKSDGQPEFNFENQ